MALASGVQSFIDEIHITETDRASDQILPEIRDLRRTRGIATPMTDEWYVARQGRDVTDEFLSGAPGAGCDIDTSRVNDSGEVAEPSSIEPSTDVGSRLRDSPDDAQPVVGVGSQSGSLLDFLSTPRSAAVIGIVGLALSLSGLTTEAGILAILGVIIAIGFLAIELLNRRRLPVLVSWAALTLLALLGIVRYYSNPGITDFGYNSSPMSAPNGSPFVKVNEIPLTANPSIGDVYSSIPEGDGEHTSLPVSCLQSGYFERQQVVWAKIVGGPYESLWIPWDYLAGIEPGSVRTLLDCNNWQWIFQDG